MEKNFRIAGYCRISVDEELDKDNTSIENQKALITDYVTRTFPDAQLDIYADRDRSGYTFEQRESYQQLRKKLSVMSMISLLSRTSPVSHAAQAVGLWSWRTCVTPDCVLYLSAMVLTFLHQMNGWQYSSGFL